MSVRLSGLNPDQRTYFQAAHRFTQEVGRFSPTSRSRNLDHLVAQYYHIQELYGVASQGLSGRNLRDLETCQADVDRRANRLFQVGQSTARGTSRTIAHPPRATASTSRQARGRAAPSTTARGQISALSPAQATLIRQLKGALGRSASVRECFTLFSRFHREIQYRCYELLFRERIVNEGIDQFLRNPQCVLPLLDQFGPAGHALKGLLEDGGFDLEDAFNNFMRLHPDQQMRCYELLCRRMIIEEGVDEFLQDPAALLREVRAEGRRLPIIDHLLTVGAPASGSRDANPSPARRPTRASPAARRPSDAPTERPDGRGGAPRSRTDQVAGRAARAPEPTPAEEPDEVFEVDDAEEIAERFEHFGRKINKLIAKARTRLNEDTRGQLDTFLGRVGEMRDYQTERTRPKVLQTLERILDGACRFKEYREKLGTLLTQANTTCGDRVTFYFGEFEMWWRICCDPQARTLPGLAKLLVGLRRKELLEEYGAALATRIGNDNEELETIVGLRAALADEFELPVSTEDILHHHCAHLEPRHIQDAREILETTRTPEAMTEILMANEKWRNMIKEQTPGLDAALEQNAGDIMNDLFTAEWDHDPGNYDRDAFMAELGRTKEVELKRLLKKATMEFLARQPVRRRPARPPSDNQYAGARGAARGAGGPRPGRAPARVPVRAPIRIADHAAHIPLASIFGDVSGDLRAMMPIIIDSRPRMPMMPPLFGIPDLD